MKKKGLIKEGDIIIKILSNSKALTIAELHFPSGTIANAHQHANEEMNYILCGTFEVLSNNSKVILRPGEILHIPTNVKHNLKCIGEEDGVILSVWVPSCEELIARLS